MTSRLRLLICWKIAAFVVQVPQRPPSGITVSVRLPEHHYRCCAARCAISSLQQVTRQPAEPDNFRLSAFRRIAPAAVPTERSAASYQYSVRTTAGVVFAVSLPAASRPDRDGFLPALPAVYHRQMPHSARYTQPCPAAAPVEYVSVPGQNIVPEPVAFLDFVSVVGRVSASYSYAVLRPVASVCLRTRPGPSAASVLSAPPNFVIFRRPSAHRLVLHAPVREHDLRQMSVAVAAAARMALPRPSPFQPRAFIAKPCRLRAKNGRVAHKLPSSFHCEYLSHARASVIRTTGPWSYPLPCAGARIADAATAGCPRSSYSRNATPPAASTSVSGRCHTECHCVMLNRPSGSYVISRQVAEDGHRHNASCRPASVIPSSNLSSSLQRKWSSARPRQYAVTGPAHAAVAARAPPNYPSRTANVLPRFRSELSAIAAVVCWPVTRHAASSGQLNHARR